MTIKSSHNDSLPNDVKKKIFTIRTVYVSAPLFKEVEQRLHFECRTLSMLGGDPECMLVTGESGAGKTWLINHYLAKYPPHETDSRTIVRVICCSIPERATPMVVVKRILQAMGDETFIAIQNDIRQLTDHLVKLLIETGTELIILDEFQNLINISNRRVIDDVAEWIKRLICESGVPMALFGMTWSSHVLDATPQLAGRIKLKRVLEPFYINSSEEIERYRTFLQMVDEKLPFRKETNFIRPEIWVRLYAFSRGNLRTLMKVIYNAATYAVIDYLDEIPPAYFKSAIDRYLFRPDREDRRACSEVNPFALPLKKVRITQLAKSSVWNPAPREKGRCWNEPIYQMPRLSLDEILKAS